MNEIKERINTLITNEKELSLEELQAILIDIKLNDNEEERKELFDYLVKELVNEIKSWTQTKEEAQNNIDKIKDNLLINGELTEEEIDDLFKKYDFTVDNVAKEEELEEENTLEDGVYQFKKNGKTGYVKKNGEEYISLSDDSELNLTNEEYEQILPQAQLLSSSNNNEVINNVINNVGKTNKNNESVVVEEPEAVIEKKEIEIIRERINELEQELTDTMTLEEIDNKIKELEQEKKSKIKEAIFENSEYEKLKRKLDIAYADGNYYPEMKKDQKRLEELKKQIKKFDELESIKKEIQSNYDKEIASLQNLKKKKRELEGLKKTYIDYILIKDDAIRKFESQQLDDEALKKAIDNYVNNCRDLNYPNEAKLRKELKEEIFENLKVKKIDKKEQNKKMLYKGLAALAGFGTGLVLSAFPGVGTIRMGLAAAKLVSSKINCHTKKHPDGKISQIIGGINNKIENSDFAKNHPKFIKKITNIKNTLKKLLESEKTQWFINGVAAGYLTGNIIEMVTGTPIFSPTPEPTPTPEPIKTPDPIPISTLPEIKSGAILDISGIKEGFISSISNSPVSLMTEVGKNVEVDRIISANGIDMVHFKQLNGKGYAWFKLSDVQQYLAKVEAAANKWTGIQR